MTIQANTLLSANFDHCYTDGFKASQTEASIDHNPFQMHSTEAHYWQEGWWDGFYEATPRFALQPGPIVSNDGWFSKLREHKWPLLGSAISVGLVAVSWTIFEIAA